MSTLNLRPVAAGWRVAALAACLTLSAVAARAELVTNGGFETGDFTGWTRSGNLLDTQVTFSIFNAYATGDFYLEAGPIGSPGGIHQTLATVPGQTYRVAFTLATGGYRDEDFFDFNWDGGASELRHDLNAPALLGGRQHVFQLTASGAQTDLRFTFRNDPNFWNLDDISVLAPVTSVPEPGTLGLAGLGLLGVLGVARAARRSRPAR